MAKKFNRSFALSALTLVCLPSLSSCGNNAKSGVVLHVLNCEDYIDAGAEAEGFSIGDSEFSDVLTGFSDYIKAKEGKDVSIVYDTFDTNETMYSSLKTGKTSYDLICPSDYMGQKMMKEGMLQPIDPDANVPSYSEYVPDYLKNVMKSIKADVNGDGIISDEESFYNYSVGYMWGTLGLLYNPEKMASDKGISIEEVMADMTKWDSAWDHKYYSEASIKDSMRDTYSMGVMHTFEEEIKSNLASSGLFDENYELTGDWEEAVNNYNPLITEIFNRSDEASVAKVKEALMSLKQNIFGFEVDSGKEDMVKGLIGMNLAWSGDAVFSMDTADGVGRRIYYSVPETGGNVWFDGWVMPKSCTGENKEYALKFLDFLSTPEVAAANMNYIGYTSFIAGDTILDLIRQWYDPRTDAMFVFQEEEGDYDYESRNEGMEEATYVSPDGGTSSWEEYAKEGDWDVVDLTYMFSGTLSDEVLEDYPSPLGDTPETNPYLFYSSEDMSGYTTFEYEGREYKAGRQFFAQYPPQDIIPKLAIMQDYGENNKYVLAMWQDVKSNNLPLAGVIVFAVILISVAVLATVIFVGKKRQHAVKVARRKGLNR